MVPFFITIPANDRLNLNISPRRQLLVSYLTLLHEDRTIHAYSRVIDLVA